MRRWLVFVLILSAAESWGATWYIDDAGNDAAAGNSTSVPWKTWTKAFSSTNCGDTLIVMDGTYTLTHGAFLLTKACTPSNPYTVIAQNERQAYIDGSAGTFVPIYLSGAAYVTVEGLRARSGDKTPSSGGTNLGVCNAYNSNHIVFRHLICSHPNRYRNAGHVIQLYNTFDSLLEENELYYFHRHGSYIGGGSGRNVIRRNYCNGRGYVDLDPGTPEVENPTDGPTEVGPDDCSLVYPGSDNIFENNIAEGSMLKCYALEAIGATVSNQFLGNICMGGAYNGYALDARTPSSATNMPKDTVLKDSVSIGTTASSFRINGSKNTILTNSAVLTGVGGFAIDRIDSIPGDGVYSATMTNLLASGVTGIGIFIDTTIGTTWTCTNCKAYNNTTNYSPSSSANYTPVNPPVATDPQMGTCQVYRPDGSNAKVNNWGADILYRYQDGLLTTVPLWDLVTGEFPHGAIVTGVNDGADAPATVHTRLNVNAGGCAFPSGYGGGGGSGGTVSIGTSAGSGDGTSTLSWNHTISVNQDQALVCLALHSDTGTVGAVASVDATGQAFALVKRQVSTSGSDAVELWHVANPTSGPRTFSATTTGSVTGMVGRSMEFDATSALHTAVSTSLQSATPTVTAPTNINEVVVDCVASPITPFAAGADQTGYSTVAHTTTSIQLGASTQPGTAGGVMDDVLGGVVPWAQVAVSLVASPADSPVLGTLTIDKFQFHKAYGVGDSAPVAGAESTTIDMIENGIAQIRSEILAGIDTTPPFGVALYCKKTGDPDYTQVLNMVGTHGLRLYGGGIVPDMDPSLTPTIQRFTPAGAFHAGALVRDEASVLIIPSMTAGDTTEVVHTIVNTNARGTVVQCQHRTDTGLTLVNAVTPTFRVIAPQAAVGF